MEKGSGLKGERLEPRLTMITLGVADLERSTEFYEALGFAKSPASQETVTFFRMKGTVLGLFARQSLADDARVDNSKPGFSGVAIAHNLRSKEAVDKAFAHAVTCGATATKTPEEVFWGGYSGYFTDPDGHLWELAYNPFAPLDDDGNMTLP